MSPVTGVSRPRLFLKMSVLQWHLSYRLLLHGPKQVHGHTQLQNGGEMEPYYVLRRKGIRNTNEQL